MPVEIMENGAPWGRKDVLPPAQGGAFVIVKIPDVTAQQVKDALQARWGCDLCDEEGDRSARRRIQILVDNLPNNVRNQLRTTGSYTATWAQVKSFVQHIRTGETV